MARSTHYSRRKTAHLGLLGLAVGACATVQPPPGGPPDYWPPVLLLTEPDSGTVVVGWTDHVVFRFDEVVTEPRTTEVEKLVIVSPRHEEIEFSWRRSALAFKPKDGWRPGAVYTVALLPGVSDLRNNRLTTGYTTVFSTGAPILDTRIRGTVIDWEAGRPLRRPLVEALHLSDSLVYVSSGDSAGGFEIPYAPPGAYALYATADQNTNSRRDRREAFDSVLISLDSTTSATLWTFTHDTVGPRLRNSTSIDSMTIRLEFNQIVAPTGPLSRDVRVRQLPDSVPLVVSAVWQQPTYDSVKTERQTQADSLAAAAADSAAADSLAADSLAVAPDTVAAADSAETPAQRRPEGRGGRRPGDAAAIPGVGGPAIDSATAQLIAERPPLSAIVIVEVAEPLEAGARYVIDASVENLTGARDESQSVLVMPEATETP